MPKCNAKYATVTSAQRDVKTWYSTMTGITAPKNPKGIPPKPKAKAKPSTKVNTKRSSTKMTLGSRKRATNDSDDESSQEDDEMVTNDDSKSVRRAKKKGKQQHLETLDSDVEMVENGDKPQKEVEEVDAIGDEDNEQLVSPYIIYHKLRRLTIP